jgi:serine palmitoyltransferase
VFVHQVYVALRIIMGEDGTAIGQNKLMKLRDNANYVRARLESMGIHVYGDYNSPVIPVMLYMPGKIAAFSR